MSLFTNTDISQNTLLTAINMQSVHQTVIVRENGLADANFILTNLMKQILIDNKNKICLVIMHNTIGHYHNVGRKMNYDIMKKVKSGDVIAIEPMKYIVDSINSSQSNTSYFSQDKERIPKELFLNIKHSIEKLSTIPNTGTVYLIIDDISHLLDMCVDIKHVITFVNCCLNLGNNVSLIINCHVDTGSDEIISNALAHMANLHIVVSPLNTGFSHDVSGIISVTDNEQQTRSRTLHYKTYENEIKAFPVGESIRYLST